MDHIIGYIMMNPNQKKLLKKSTNLEWERNEQEKQPKCDTKTTSKNGSLGTKATKDNKDLSKGGKNN
jgi:hypothetical protein